MSRETPDIEIESGELVRVTWRLPRKEATLEVRHADGSMTFLVVDINRMSANIPKTELLPPDGTLTVPLASSANERCEAMSRETPLTAGKIYTAEEMASFRQMGENLGPPSWSLAGTFVGAWKYLEICESHELLRSQLAAALETQAALTKRAEAAESDWQNAEAALRSIAANTCCAGCGEAAKVAKAALAPVATAETK